MKKRFLSAFLTVAMVFISFGGFGTPTIEAVSEGSNVTVSYLPASDLLYDLMEEATLFIVAQHKALGGSHYAYTEGLYEESTGDAAVYPESVFHAGSRLIMFKLEAVGDQVKKTEKVILNSSSGCIRDPDVSADGTKCLFSWKKSNSDDFHIYEMELTSGNYEYKQLTFGSGVADFECLYLPNGEIMFSSSRTVQTVDCWKTPVSNLYKMGADGSNIVRLGYDQVHTTYPTLTEDGRVIYTRWDYNDRTQMYIQAMFQMNPDGTNQTELYGNNSNFPTTLIHTRQISGEVSKYVSIATGHHTLQAGKLCVVDVSENRDGADSVTFPFGDSKKTDDVDKYGQVGAMYQYPYAISDSQFLVSYCASGWASNQADTPFGLWLMDSETNEKIELIAGSPYNPSAQVVPVKTRGTFVRPTSVDYSASMGTYYIGDVYQGEAVEGVERGTVKQIRVVALEYRPYAIGLTDAAGSGTSNPYTPIATGNGSWDVKHVLGVATVYEDGSAMFSVPSETPVYFQLLDQDGNMIQTMRSWSTLMPNEVYSCVGCHENNNTAPPAASGITIAMKTGVEMLKPDAWQTDDADRDPNGETDGFDYLEEIQPIWDANCISCHNNKEASYLLIDAAGVEESGVTSNSSYEERKIFGKEQNWEYYISASNDPANGWNNVGFTGSWSVGKAGFGDRSNVASVGTSWTGDSKWLFVRKEFTVADLSEVADAMVKLNIFYDDTPTVYLNGQVIFTDNTWVDNFTEIVLDVGQYLKQGENVLAISINQHAGGRYIDTELSLLIPQGDNSSSPFSLEGDNIGSSRMSRYFPLSYLVLTGSRGEKGIEWVGTASNQFTNWLSSMSGPEIQPVNTYGAISSNLMKVLREGHHGVDLSDTELRTIAAWIDLCVPAYGSYDANNHWNTKEIREAEEEQNKRDYYVMKNEYARMALAGELPEGTIRIEYYDQSASRSYSVSGEGLADLYFPKKIQTGDIITVILPEGVSYIGFTLTPKMGESIIYCPNGTFTYVVPDLSGMVTTLSQAYANTSNYITARVLTDGELTQKRNLAENGYDYPAASKVSGQYPHVTASSECRNSQEFFALNAIDGFCNNVGHGVYPKQSWGPNNTAGQWIELDFGRAVNAEELGIVIRYDVGHDTWFRSATVELTYVDGTVETKTISILWTGAEQIFDLDTAKPIKKLKLTDLTAAVSGGWAAFTEIAVYGTEVLS